MVYLLKMVIFYSYVSSPEGMWICCCGESPLQAGEALYYAEGMHPRRRLRYRGMESMESMEV